MAERLGHKHFQARAYNDLGIAKRHIEAHDEAIELLGRSRDLAREAGNLQFEATALTNLVVVLVDVGDYAGAARTAEQAMAANAGNGDAWGVAIDRLNYTIAVLKSEGARAAHARFVEWAEEIMSFRDKELAINLMELGAGIASGFGDARLAARLLAGADTQRAGSEMPRSIAEVKMLDSCLVEAHTALSASEWEQAYAAGVDLTPEQAIELVLGVAVPQEATP
jgi:tetratricopeptide (TPR) repeat protein